MVQARLDWKESGKITVAQSRAIAEGLVDRIRTRTQSGTDIHSFPFHPYTPAYAAKKGGTVNLTETGAMLASLHVAEATATGCVIACADEKAPWHQHGTATIPARPFVGFTSSDENWALDQVLRAQAVNYLHQLNGTTASA